MDSRYPRRDGRFEVDVSLTRHVTCRASPLRRPKLIAARSVFDGDKARKKAQEESHPLALSPFWPEGERESRPREDYRLKLVQ